MIATSRKAHTRTVPGAIRPRAGFHRHSGSAPGVVVDGRRLRTILVGLGIAALTGLTSWAVASVSIWLVPAYLLLMVVTFAMPRGERAASPAADPRAGTSGADADESGRGMGEDHADGMGEPRPEADPVPDIPADGSPEAPTPPSDLAGSAAAKPRRTRSRSRKAAKTAAEPVLEPSPVTWIRVGPGKFVRADASIQDSPQAQAEEVAPVADPATDPSQTAADPSDTAADIHREMVEPESAVAVEAHPATDELAPPAPSSEEVAQVADVPTDAPETPIADVPTDAPEYAPPASEVVADASPVIEALEAVSPAPSQAVPLKVSQGSCPLVSTEATPDSEESVSSSVEEVTGSVVEEYGIAPSAFGPETWDFPVAESLDHGVFDAFVPYQADPHCIDEPGGLPPAVDTRSDRPGSRRQRSWVRTAFLPVGIANVSQGRGSDPASSRRHLRPRPRLRADVRCPSPVDARLQHASRRASGRTQHVQRAWRPRSPPGRRA